MIVIDRISKHHGHQATLRDVSFTARPSRVTALLGPNGAGKTTVLRILVGLVRAEGGSATVDGRPYHQLDPPLRHVGCLLEGAGAHPSRTGLNHLRWLALSNGIDRDRIGVVLDQVGLTEAAGLRVGGYSVGMRQRLGLAAALLGDPPVLVLDEPTNGLDPAGIRWIGEQVRRWAAEGRTVLVTSHQLTEMADSADDVVILDRGRVMAAGTTSEVIGTHDTLADAFFAAVADGVVR
ncbi:MAG: ABC transporter ATP-binding protein [Acidimicrobiales bacterium]